MANNNNNDNSNLSVPIDKSKYGKYGNKNNNCVNFDTSKFKFNQLTSLEDDKCLLQEKDKQSIGVGNYMLDSYNVCNCKISNVVDNATQNPTIPFKDGFGISECNVNKDSMLRVGKTKKFPKCPDQLFTRPFATMPYMGRGSGDSYVESELQTGNYYANKRQCNVLSGVTIDNFFLPMVKNLKDNIQNPMNIIQEDNNAKWVRGGIPTRDIVKDIDYLERCSSDNKEKEILVNRKKYLQNN